MKTAQLVCLGIALLTISANGRAALISLEITAVIESNGFTDDTPNTSYTKASQLEIGEEFLVNLYFDTDPGFFNQHSYGVDQPEDTGDMIRYPVDGTRYPLSTFSFSTIDGEIIGGDGAISSEIRKIGYILSGYLLSGPADYDMEFSLNTLNWTGLIFINGLDGSFDSDGQELWARAIGGKLTGASVSDSGDTALLLIATISLLGGASRRAKRNPKAHRA